MLLNLTDLSSESLQSQIVRQIRAKILVDELPAGADLPSIRALSREQHISVITVKRAYESLEREGLIHSRRGKGFFVSDLVEERKRSMANRRFFDNLKPVIDLALAEGLEPGEIIRIVDDILKKENKQNNHTGEHDG
ncbi:MAG: GntR family transcriptional regulator [bacterium]|nr:GntR family transcriptional regulator [bacterium]